MSGAAEIFVTDQRQDIQRFSIICTSTEHRKRTNYHLCVRFFLSVCVDIPFLVVEQVLEVFKPFQKAAEGMKKMKLPKDGDLSKMPKNMDMKQMASMLPPQMVQALFIWFCFPFMFFDV
jgi:hypothetical protein